ncbi:MAG: PEGA domain-containing protein [Gammaproteobacteria bacterium]|nr:PEGA domain-containing protein [Gammaproteobacteria bacterium]NNL64161.1 PEGA domain-containing protein [Woeseiaceae bacterium]
MNFDHLFIRDVEGERRVDASALPLRVGTGSDCELRLPGPGGGPAALLDLLDGTPFVQPVGRVASVTLNGEPLETSRRLTDGDELGFYGSRIMVGIDGERLLVDVRLEDSAYVTRPPDVADDESLPDEEAIAPTSFSRAAETAARDEMHRASPLRYIVGGLLVFLLTASYLLFSATSVNFEVVPAEPDSIDVEGGWFRLPIGDRMLLRKGNYTVNVEKQGYFDIKQTFVVGDEPSRTLTLEMRRKPGRLVVNVEPAVDAVVTIDETQVGKAPFGPVTLEPGDHLVEVASGRFLPFRGVVPIPGLDRDEFFDVQLVPRWAEVAISSEPAGARILAGDAEVGVTPATVQLLEGTHEVTLSKDGFAAWDGTVVAEPNVAQTLPTIMLQPADARLIVNTIPRGANVTVNGRYRGQSPMTLSLTPDVDYEIGLSKAGYGVTTRSLRLASNASEAITVDLSARLGTVTVQVNPADATVYVDGRARGKGKTTVRLSAVPHSIEVRRGGYVSWKRTVTPRPGYPQTLTATLRSEAAIAEARIAKTLKSPAGQTLRRVEPATFTMGASRSEMGRRANEVIVPVTITRPFLIGVHEVTNKEFAEFRANHNSGSEVHVSLGADNNPVANVTWEDAIQYCNWLSQREGRTPAYRHEFGRWVAVFPLTDGYRLPTEAEWALAMRYGGQQQPRKFWWGAAWPPPQESGNYADRSALEVAPSILPAYDDGYPSTAPVGSFKANALGIHDGGGNVAEWVNDYYTVPTPGITTPVVDPTGPDRGTSHVIRGSSWRQSNVTALRLSFRDFGVEPRHDVGFRVARFAD